MTELFFTDGKPRFVAIAQEFDLAPMQLHALRILEPGAEQPMSALAGTLGCDASNVTGIVDRLATRGLIERRDAPEDRRVRLIALTAEGERLREPVLERFRVPPAPISSLSVEDQRELRDLLRRALGQGERG
jgi:DNA-binding MarR family transcriptional regulator